MFDFSMFSSRAACEPGVFQLFILFIHTPGLTESYMFLKLFID